LFSYSPTSDPGHAGGAGQEWRRIISFIFPVI
jgi:hypothetical protein